jgi:hypothetical protein
VPPPKSNSTSEDENVFVFSNGQNSNVEQNQETAPLDDVTKLGTGYSNKSNKDDAEQNGLLIIPSKYASSKPNETFSGTVNGKANNMEENK